MSEPAVQGRRRDALLLRGGTALWGDALEPRPFETLLIEGGRVVGMDVGAGDRDDPVVMDLDGAYVLPGLIDCHVHFDLAAHPAAYEHYGAGCLVRSLTAVHNGLVALTYGITAVRDLGSLDHGVIDYAAKVAGGQIVGPRVIAAGRPITTTGGHFAQYGRIADGPDAVRLAVREQIAGGARVIKLMATGGISTPGDPGASQFTLEELSVAVDEAHRRGAKVAAHAHTRDGVLTALKAGVDTIEHAAFADEETLEALVSARATLVPTVSALTPIEPGRGIPAATVEKSLRARPLYRDSTRRAIAAGVTIAAGTDAGTALNPIGGLVDELELYVALGMTPSDAVRSATVTAGRAIGGELGVLAPDRPADLVVVDENPTENLTVLRRPRHVISAGRLIDLDWSRRTVAEMREVVTGSAGTGTGGSRT
ncbi:MAG: amidohydrolase family protein [Blastococcus sp.]|jgi:imidazolonepropionase-like amidohydrolase|nr:amidohydrolase family protein [Blastococcus sp.]